MFGEGFEEGDEEDDPKVQRVKKSEWKELGSPFHWRFGIEANWRGLDDMKWMFLSFLRENQSQWNVLEVKRRKT